MVIIDPIYFILLRNITAALIMFFGLLIALPLKIISDHGVKPKEFLKFKTWDRYIGEENIALGFIHCLQFYIYLNVFTWLFFSAIIINGISMLLIHFLLKPQLKMNKLMSKLNKINAAALLGFNGIFYMIYLLIQWRKKPIKQGETEEEFYFRQNNKKIIDNREKSIKDLL